MIGLLAGCGGFGFGYGAYIAVALLLMALAGGMCVCAKANCQENASCKKCGKFMGWFIVIVAFLSLACLAYRCVSQCGKGSAGDFCPRSHMQSETPAPTN
ncbi:MAG: hypothetical protein A3I05_09125 [Deltaproteobacteria bacterium RIFCSPLOWO2_02_FULL_44_10]|nr:MAG: hypothetical protein A3C46_08490 [Deltaproteobacteria bacterium RIFCSPHIGHO2_02_FULL_44_16]OGQ45264.1 MAG: hypothetical protein A3I05_09125 [Deltaproteobacteria bacterium RIFCSPLOWO2_02_FULL_44_10]